MKYPQSVSDTVYAQVTFTAMALVDFVFIGVGKISGTAK
jgi:hypothetical protein